MKRIGIVSIVAAAAGFTVTTALAAGPTLGPPLDATGDARVVPDTYRLAELRAADPDGGPPWGVAIFFIQPPPELRDKVRIMCTELGRVLDGKLGMLTVDNVFRPYQPGRAPRTSCAGVDPRHGERASGNILHVLPSRIGGACSPTGQEPLSAACDAANLRTVTTASLGNGILNAQIKSFGSRRWRPLPVTPGGQLLTVGAGTFTDITLPAIRVRATVCGPDARTDIRGWKMVRQGCVITFEIPDGPRPARETPASRRARKAPRLYVPVRVVERPGRASLTRYVARLRLPISVQNPQEGYAAEVRGPSGSGCRRQGWTDTHGDYITSYLQIAGESYDVPIVPIDYRRGVWCRGTYTVTVLFKRRHGAGRRTRVARKVVGTATFRIR